MVPEDCKDFFIKDKLDELRFDSDMLSNLTRLIAATRRQYISDDFNALNKIKEHLFLDVPITPQPRKGQRTPLNVFMIFVMLLNVAVAAGTK